WVIAVGGSVGPVLMTWSMTVLAYLVTCWAALFVGSCLVVIFPGLDDSPPARLVGLCVVATVGAFAAGATFYHSAIHSWAIREREVGRVPGARGPADAARP